MSIPDHFDFYNVVLFVHIASAIVAFGVTFTYPLIVPLAQRESRRNLPYLHRAQALIGTRIITPGATLVLLSGVYLTADRWDFGDTFVSAGILIILILLGLAGAFFAPRERRLAEIAERDVAAAGAGEVTLSADYERLARPVAVVGALGSALVLVAVFLMVMRPL